MKPASFNYVRAESVLEASQMLREADGRARLLAGGQSLVPTLNLRLARPETLVDIKRITSLRVLSGDSVSVTIGAGWTHAEIEDGVVEDPTGGMLRHVARGIAYRAVRNRGTLGGSLAHADPAADWIATMAGIGASIVIEGSGGVRQIPADRFMQGAFTTALGADELLCAVSVPRFSSQARWAYAKLCRKSGEFAKSICVILLDPLRGITRMAIGATEGAPLLLTESAAALSASGAVLATAVCAREIDALMPHLPPAARGHHLATCERALKQLDQSEQEP